MNTKDVTALTGISARALHYYEEVGLIFPSRDSQNGYRRYSAADLLQLQQILAFKRCGFSLREISLMLTDPRFDRERAFALQKKLLLHQRESIDGMISALERMTKYIEDEEITEMDKKTMFDGFDFDNNLYEEEARALYGDDAVDSSNAHVAAMSKEEQGAACSAWGRFSQLLRLLWVTAQELLKCSGRWMHCTII